MERTSMRNELGCSFRKKWYMDGNLGRKPAYRMSDPKYWAGKQGPKRP